MWPEIIETRNITANKIVEELKKLSAAYGLPEQIFSDNGLQICIAMFTKIISIKHIKSAP